jgi:hypothetical protein
MLVYRSSVAGAAVSGALLLGCSAPDLPTDLRKDGPPNVTAVTVASDLRTPVDPSPPALSRLLEDATYCRIGDVKRPGHVGLPDISTVQECPENLAMPADKQDAAEAAPPAWYVRVVFDMLLDPNVEDLVDVLDSKKQPTGIKAGTLVNTQPVTLKCNGVDIKYDGYYVPNGNSISWPLGPALFVQPVPSTVFATIPTGAACEIGLKDNVHNKKGQSVTTERTFKFKIGGMKLRFSAPDPAAGKPGSFELDPTLPVQFFWTAQIGTSPAALPAAADIKIFAGPNAADGSADTTVCSGGGTAIDPANITTAVDGMGATTDSLIMDLALGNVDMLSWAEKTTYHVTFASTASVKPLQGGAAGTFGTYDLCFHTKAAQ